MGGICSRHECEEKGVSYFIRQIRTKVVTWVTGLGWEVYVTERGYKRLHWVDVAPDSVLWRAVVSTVMYLRAV